MATAVSRRHFARLFAVGGSAALFSDPAWARQAAPASALAPGGAAAGEAFWKSVRDQFVMPPDLAVMNAANLCPASRPVLETLPRETQSVDRDPSPQQPRPALSGEGEHAQGARRVPARDAGRDHHHAQHQRVEQPGVERPRPQGRRRGHRPCRQPPEQPDRVAREGQALRLLGRDRRAEESASRDRTTTSRRSRARSRRGRRCCASRTSRARSAI